MIPTTTIDVLRECSHNSFRGAAFSEVVKALAAAGVESYHADLFRHEKTFYLPDGESHIVPDEESYAVQLSPSLVAPEFDAAAVAAAVREIQQKRIDYLEFLVRIMKGGTSSYSVYLRGRRAVYVGRTGDEHVEWFPGSK